MARIWNDHGKFPHEIQALHPLEREFIYQATLLKIEKEEAEAKRLEGKTKGG